MGARLYALAALTVESTLTRESQPILRRVAQRARETTHLCVLRGGNVLTIASELSPHEFRTTGWEGITTAAWRTPSGRVLLSDWDDDSLTPLVRRAGQDQAIVGPVPPRRGFSVLPSPPADRQVVSDLESLRAELARIRANGYALLDEELELGVVGASAPGVISRAASSPPSTSAPPRPASATASTPLARFVASSAKDLSRAVGFDAITSGSR